MSKPVIDNPQTLAGIVQGLGGTVLPGATFRFDLPLASVRDVIPRLNELGVGCRKVDERVEQDPLRPLRTQSMATIELFRREQPDH